MSAPALSHGLSPERLSEARSRNMYALVAEGVFTVIGVVVTVLVAGKRFGLFFTAPPAGSAEETAYTWFFVVALLMTIFLGVAFALTWWSRSCLKSRSQEAKGY